MITDIFSKASLLHDNDLLIVRYKISKSNIGKIQLSNSINLLPKKDLDKLKKVLEYIEDYSTDYTIVPSQNSKP
jgi:hypothetical protein